MCRFELESKLLRQDGEDRRHVPRIEWIGNPRTGRRRWRRQLSGRVEIAVVRTWEASPIEDDPPNERCERSREQLQCHATKRETARRNWHPGGRTERAWWPARLIGIERNADARPDGNAVSLCFSKTGPEAAVTSRRHHRVHRLVPLFHVRSQLESIGQQRA